MHRLCKLLASLLFVPALHAQVAVHHPEARMRGFVTLEDLSGHFLATGELTQSLSGAVLTSRLAFRFKDGSVDDETSTFTQRPTLHLLTDHHIQHGASFPKSTDLSIDTRTGTIAAHTRDAGGKQTQTTDHLDLPADLTNGMILATFANLDPAAPETRLSYLALGGKPRLIHLTIRPVGQDPLTIGTLHRTATHFQVHFDLGGLAGVVAPMIGKQPEDAQIWVLGGPAPLVVKEDGQFFEDGPVWRIVLTSPTWPR